MKALLRCAAALYPAAWRQRYGEEFAALIEDSDGGWLEFLDVCKGAMKMQIVSGGLWRFAAACGVAGLLVAGLVAWRTPNEYRSVAVLRMAPANLDQEIEKLNQTEQKVLSRSAVADVIRKFDLYPEQRKQEPLEDIVQDMRNRQIQIRMLTTPKPQAPSLAFSITFDNDDPRKARAVTAELTAQFVSAMKDSAPLEVLDPASLPQSAFAPNRPVLLALGLMLGVVTAFVLAGIRRWPLVPLTGLVVAGVVLPATYLIPDQFRSTAVLRGASVDPAPAARKVVSDREYLQWLIQGYRLYPNDPNAVDRMQRNLHVEPVHTPAGQFCVVSFDYSDRTNARAVLLQIVVKAGGDILDPPSLPERPFAPNRLSLVLAALLAGLMLGAIALVVRRHRAPALFA